jgi:hypothetical protein
VALALVAQVSDFGQGFVLFALVILPLVFFVGLATFLRMGASNYHDALCVVGMNRIRHAYIELAPEVERYFVMGVHDDLEGLDRTMAVEPGRSSLVDIISGTPTVVCVLNSAVAAVVAAIVALQLVPEPLVGLVVGIVSFLFVFGLQSWLVVREIARVTASYEPLFPKAPAPEG